MLKILSISITTFQESTWGRVYVQYEKDNQLLFAFKNWIKFDEKTYFGSGSLENEPAYSWFLLENRHVFNDYTVVLDEKADHLYLTPERHREQYGVPSKILKRLLIEIKANAVQKVENRRGWYSRSQLEEVKVSAITLHLTQRIITFTDYDVTIKLPPRQFLIYLFYSQHPDGIYRKQVSDYEAELKQLYSKISVSIQDGKNEAIINDLISLDSNSWDEQISKIKKTFIDTLGEQIASYYLIRGNRNESYALSLDSKLVTLEEK